MDPGTWSLRDAQGGQQSWDYVVHGLSLRIQLRKICHETPDHAIGIVASWLARACVHLDTIIPLTGVGLLPLRAVPSSRTSQWRKASLNAAERSPGGWVSAPE